MLAVNVVLVTVGVVLAVPALVRAIDGIDSNVIADGIGIGALVAGAAGLLAQRVGAGTAVTLIVAVALGLAAGVAHPEALARIRGGAAGDPR